MTSAPLPSSMATAALQYARQGWPVFPCREADESYQVAGETRVRKAKAPYTGNGVKDATTDEAVILGWWKRWPNAMIGLAMGRNGLFVLDFDPRVDPETGEIFTLERLKAELEAQIGCALPVSLAAITQSDGVHVYLKQPADGGDPIRNRGNLPRHVDVRGLGGYVIAPPSVMAETGARYRWHSGRVGMEPAEAPAALIAILRSKSRKEGTAPAPDAPSPASPPPRQQGNAGSGDDPVDVARRRYALRALEEEVRELAATPIGGGRHGGRNRGIYFAALKLGGYVPDGWLSESVVRASLTAVINAMPHNNDPQGALQTLENGLRDGMASPHDMSDIGARAGSGRAPPDRRGAAGRNRPPPPDSSPAPAPHDAAAPAPFQSGSVSLTDLQEGERAALIRAAGAWLERRIAALAAADVKDEEKVEAIRKLAFAAGLRVGAGLLAEQDTLRAIEDVFAVEPGLAPDDIKGSIDAGRSGRSISTPCAPCSPAPNIR